MTYHLNNGENMDQKTRNLIADRMRKSTKGEIFLASWDDKRIAWEENHMMTWCYWEDINKFYEIIDAATEGTGYFIELINSVEAHICKC